MTLPIYRVKVGTQKELIKDHVFFNETSDDYFASDLVAYKSDIPSIPTDLVNESSLENTLNDYALKNDIKSISTDLVNESSLANTLSHYVKNSHIEYTLEHIVGDTSKGLKYSDEYRFTIIDPPSSFTTQFKYEWNKKDGSIGSAIIEVWIINGSFYRVIQPLINFIDMDGCKMNDGFANMYIFPDDEITYSNNLLIMRTEGGVAIMEFAVRDGIRFIADESYIYDGIAYKSDFSDYVLKSELPKDHVTTSSLTNTLSSYSTMSECDDKYVKYTSTRKIRVNEYSEGISVNLSSPEYWIGGFNIYAPNLNDGNAVVNWIGTNGEESNHCAYFGYRKPSTGFIGLADASDIINWTVSNIHLNRNTSINGNLTVTGTVTNNGSSTITHYSPIEAGEDISLFKIGKPVFASGHVYKRVESNRDSEGIPQYRWESSTINDRSDCICSVLINGTYKEFVGVFTDVDELNGCITFATHGDFLFNVDDANLYQIGDVILYNGKILDENYAMTLHIQQNIVCKVTAKINETTQAIFRS